MKKKRFLVVVAMFVYGFILFLVPAQLAGKQASVLVSFVLFMPGAYFLAGPIESRYGGGTALASALACLSGVIFAIVRFLAYAKWSPQDCSHDEDVESPSLNQGDGLSHVYFFYSPFVSFLKPSKISTGRAKITVFDGSG